jgi:hypothetical protein
MTASVQLIAALDGDWDITQLPSPPQASRKPGKTDYQLQR